MAKIKVVKKKDVIDPVIAQTFFQTARAYLRDNIRQIGAISLVVLVVGGAVGLWIMARERAEQTALTQFSEALAIMERSTAGQHDNATYYERALEKLTALQQQHASTKAGTAALFYTGVCHFHLKHYDDAIAFYTKFLDQAGSGLRYLASFAYEGLGYAHEMKNQYAEAISWFERQRKEGAGAVNAMAVLNLARCYEKRGDSAAACSLYREFVEQNPGSSLKDLARFKISTICDNNTGGKQAQG
ncbi:MAG: tetratricopeptide repeat protein [Desulfobacterota bacterium]|nr:tetratricopeptide repeat protein [Thermodesulfobacteriota bacterium]